MSVSDFVREFVVDEALRLGIGETKRTVCPMCRATHENSFLIEKGYYLISYRCWRASCGCHGLVWSINKGHTQDKITPPKKAARPFTCATTPLPPIVLSILEEKYQLAEEDFSSRSVKWCEELESLVFPCYDFDAFLKGIVTKRLFKKDGVNKSLLFWKDEPPNYYLAKAPKWGANVSGKSREVWLVEDCLSSIRLHNAGVSAIALLGTHLADSLAVELSSKFEGLVICLDPDATAKAATIAANYRLLFNTVKIVVPKKDPKDLSQEELEAMLRG